MPGMTSEEFAKIVSDWLATARHPRFQRPYTELVYQPMLELLAYLRANGFKTFIVSGGGIEFMRPWTEKIYGIPPEQVVGSSIKTRFEMQDGRPVVFRLPEINFIDDKAGKPIGINQHIGRRPLAAFGNSDGDLEMLQYTTMSGGLRFGLIVHHTDAEREYAYDRKSHFGKLDKALDAAAVNKWTVVNMKNDWKRIFPGGVDARRAHPWEIVMMLKTCIAGSTPTICSAGILGVLALLFASVFAPSVVVAQAGGVPNLEFAQGCRNTASGDAAVLNTCMRDEQRARQKLTAEWETFPHGDRTECTALAKLGPVLQSYVELITCLEMAKDARALPKSAKE